ncbi:SH3 domain-containing protein [Streptomyces sp. NPDC059002]|uniref:SH3 domain-containing protein n=1 Tax=Streptomyces sp. NPDC059002 TaxID=3346690 RepID=UPI003690F7D0
MTVDSGERGPEWLEFVFVTAPAGSGRVPARHLSGPTGRVRVVTAYDTTELAAAAGERLAVLAEDVRGGWVWCRAADGREGWVPVSRLMPRE